eukprot:m.44384 g.44384  ORF g.44384 m.44384 type:complete len:69 (+) comp7164_c1_seq1:585-791(+)
MGLLVRLVRTYGVVMIFPCPLPVFKRTTPPHPLYFYSIYNIYLLLLPFPLFFVDFVHVVCVCVVHKQT